MTATKSPFFFFCCCCCTSPPPAIKDPPRLALLSRSLLLLPLTRAVNFLKWLIDWVGHEESAAGRGFTSVCVYVCALLSLSRWMPGKGPSHWHNFHRSLANLWLPPSPILFFFKGPVTFQCVQMENIVFGDGDRGKEDQANGC